MITVGQININIRLDETVKKEFEAVCAEMGLTMTTAFTVFARTVVRERRIPFELSAGPESAGQAAVTPHGGATMVDERYEITEEERAKILDNVFYSLKPLKLKVFSAREKKKLVILRTIAESLEPSRRYTEKELNALLADIYADFATLRRYLVEYGFMERTRDCSEYWRKEPPARSAE